MKIRFFALFIGLLAITAGLKAAKVDTLFVHSPAMNKEIQVVTICPDKALRGQQCPVVYLLHGYNGHALTWLNIKPELPRIADREGIIFVCPDGKNSWYWDSPLRKDYRYETFVARELVDYIDHHFATRPHPHSRAIAGLSMGGHGAMWLSIRHKDVFGAAGSMSGGLDIRPFPRNWEMEKQLGPADRQPQTWEEYTVINQLDKIGNGDLALIIDCGVDDFFLKVNRAVHRKLVEKKIAHDFTVRPGGHTAAYWNNAIDYQILFFSKFFNQSK